MHTRIDTTLTFGHDGNAQEAQTYGWLAGEDGFTWTSGTESGLMLKKPLAPYGFYIEYRINPALLTPHPMSQRMQIRLDRHVLPEVRLDHAGTYAVFVNESSVEAGRMNLTIGHPDAIQAESEGRNVAIAFHQIRILSATKPLSPALNRHSSIPLADGDPADSVESIFGIPARELVTSFETVAGNCEFGSVQRKCGVEPLALLRFAGSTVTSSIQGIDTEFAGIGEDIRPWIADNAIREWMIYDAKYHLNYHTMIPSGDVSRYRIMEMERGKIGFLRKKFFDDLAGEPKIYVCSDSHAISQQEAVALFLALRRKSEAWMLWVQVAPEGGHAGTVEEIMPGLMRGYIDRLAPAHDGTDVSWRGWLTILANARSVRLFGRIP